MRVKRFILGTHFEQVSGAATAISFGDWVLLSGVYPVDDFGVPFTSPDIYKQALRCAQTVRKLCDQMHLLNPVILRVRAFVQAGEDMERTFRALYDGFAEHQPAMTLLHVHSHIYEGVKILLECDLATLA